MMLSGGSVSAATVSKINFSLTIDGTKYTCTMDVTRTNESSGTISNDILLHTKSDDCQFVGGGTIGKLDFDGSGPTHPGNIATLTLEPTNVEIPNLLVLLKLTKDIQFQSGNRYYVYGWEDIAAEYKPLGKGKYTVVE